MVDAANGSLSRGPIPIEVRDDKYSALLASDESGPVVRIRGTVSTPNPALVLNPFLDAVHKHVQTTGLRTAIVDLRELEFCNSSGFKSFIHWIERIRTLPKASQYRLRFVLSSQRKWQRTSLLALSCFATDLVEIAS